MKVERGGAAVKAHAIEAGIDQDLAKIIAAFGGAASVKDMAIFTPGKVTHTGEYPQKTVRVRPGGDGQGVSTKAAINIANEQAKARKYK